MLCKTRQSQLTTRGSEPLLMSACALPSTWSRGSHPSATLLSLRTSL